MFKITNAEEPDRYNVLQYMYIKEAHMNLLLTSALNVDWDGLLKFMQGRVAENNELEWAQMFLRLCPKDSAMIADSGALQSGIVYKAGQKDL